MQKFDSKNGAVAGEKDVDNLVRELSKDRTREIAETLFELGHKMTSLSDTKY